MISGKTALYGIFGYPVNHSFSPGMHNAAFAKLGMDACYVAFPVHPDYLGEAVKAVMPLGIKGLNITVPHKEKVIQFLDDLSEEARLIGAVNTIDIRNDRMIGHNTDGRGFLRSLREETGFRPKGKNILIVGSGGAARAIGFSLALEGAANILLADIDLDKASALASDIRAKTGVVADKISVDNLARAAADAHCIVNATPLGLKKGDPLPVPKNLLNKSHLVCDLVYNPPDTQLLKAARLRKARTLSGIGMLLYQGVIAFEIWTGRKAPVSVMKKALIQQMKRRPK